MNWLQKILACELLARLSKSGPGEAKTRPLGYISARVYRAATGKWEDLGIIATAHKGTT